MGVAEISSSDDAFKIRAWVFLPQKFVAGNVLTFTAKTADLERVTSLGEPLHLRVEEARWEVELVSSAPNEGDESSATVRLIMPVSRRATLPLAQDDEDEAPDGTQKVKRRGTLMGGPVAPTESKAEGEAPSGPKRRGTVTGAPGPVQPDE